MPHLGDLGPPDRLERPESALLLGEDRPRRSSDSGSGRVAFAPASIQAARVAFSCAESFFSPGGISSASIRSQSRLSSWCPGTIASPDSPPRIAARANRRSSFPLSLGSSPWQWKQWVLKIGRTSASKLGASEARAGDAGASPIRATVTRSRDGNDLRWGVIRKFPR